MRKIQHETCSFGDFTLDLTRGCLLCGTEEIRLRPKSFEVLKYLVENSVRLVTKTELLEAVWRNTFVTDNSLVQCMIEVRRALGDVDQQFIRTVPRRGYIFTAEVIHHQIKPSRAWSLTDSGGDLDSRASIESIAILPLLNGSADPQMEYLSDGLTENIIDNLSQLSALRVMAWGTVGRLKAQEMTPGEVGRMLGVRAVLTGRVLQFAEHLIVSAELIDVIDGARLWGQRYDRRLADIFTVQEEIAREISENLRLRLTMEEKRRLTKRHTENTEAYHAYLRGRHYWNKRDTAWLKKGVHHFREAIELDPGYAFAYAGLSDSYTLLVVREAIHPDEGFAKAKAAAAMALRIEPTLAEAHASLGHAMLHNWEWESGEIELQKAIELNSGYASAHHWYSEHLTAMGRCDDSIAELKLAANLDPLSLVINADLGRAFYYARQYDQVIQQEARTLEMDPDFWLSHINLGRSYAQQGMHKEAIAELSRASDASPGNTEVLSFLGFAYAAAEEEDKARQMLYQLFDQSKLSHVPPYHFAILYAGLGDGDRAFEWLEHAYEQHAVDLFTLKVEPMFDSLRTDGRFSDLLRRMGLG